MCLCVAFVLGSVFWPLWRSGVSSCVVWYFGIVVGVFCGVAVVVFGLVVCDGVWDHFGGYVLGLRCGLFLWSLL